MTLNWDWSCSGVDPPSLHVDSTTICVGCNITVVIRVGSPGDSGNVTQTTGSVSAGTGADGAVTAQTVNQAVAPAAAAVAAAAAALPSAPAPAPAATPPLSPEPAPVAFPGAPVQPALPAALAQAPVAIPPAVLIGAAAAPARYHPSAPPTTTLPPRLRVVPWVELRVEHLVRTVVIVRERVVRKARATRHRLASVPLRLPPAPPARAPLSLGAAAVEGAAHGSASVGALSTGTDGLGFFGLFVSVSLLAPLVRGAFARARPHPPG